MGETDVTFRHLLRGIPRPILRLAFPHRALEPAGPLDPSEVQNDRRLTRRDRQTTMQLLYVVSAAIRGSDTARRIFHVESIIQDPNVQELIHEWEDKGRIKGRAEGRIKGRAEGRVEGERKALQTLLRTRGLSATAEERARIEGCTDSKKLEQWIVRAVSAESVSEVLGTNRKPRAARPRIKQRAGK